MQKGFKLYFYTVNKIVFMFVSAFFMLVKKVYGCFIKKIHELSEAKLQHMF